MWVTDERFMSKTSICKCLFPTLYGWGNFIENVLFVSVQMGCFFL